MVLNWKRFYIKEYPENPLRYGLWILLWVISLGGLFYPYLGYIVPVMMATLLILSFYRGRYWCGNICPRGSFFDIIVKRIFRVKDVPPFFRSNLFRVSFLIFFFMLFGWRLSRVMASQDPVAQLGFIFVTVCLFTTIIGFVLATLYSPRSWCIFCPMGTLQSFIHSFRSKGKGINIKEEACIKCATCSRVCPMHLEPFRDALASGSVKHLDCIKCGLCIQKCPTGALEYGSYKQTVKTHNKRSYATVEKVNSTEKITELVLRPDKPLEWKPGQYILVRVSREPLVYRAFSVIDYENDLLRIAIKPVKGGFASKHIAGLTAGQRLALEGPYGDFTLPENPKVFLIAAGIGITPFLSLARKALDEGKEVTLVHSARDRKSLFYYEELKELEQRGMRYIVTLTREKDDSFLHGRLTKHLREMELDQAHYFVCGMPGLIEDVIHILKDKGIDTKNISHEGF
ncbi:MAG: 4Fe-4S binding protein [Nanobdellota archaeon]